MPVVSITLLPGYEPSTQRLMVDRVANAVRSVIAAPEAGTTVFINEVSTYRRDGKVFSAGGPAHPVATEIVRSFLQAMQNRDMTSAQTFLHSGFQMRFPGGKVMHSLQELLNWTQLRYIQIAKHYDSFEESWQGDTTVVFCHGTLQGKWLNGETFEGIRFMDRLEVKGGLISRQDVWNDLAEHRKS